MSEVSPNWFKLTETQKVEDKVEFKLENYIKGRPSSRRCYKTVSWRLSRPLADLENFLPAARQFYDSIETLKMNFHGLDTEEYSDITFINLKCLHMYHPPNDFLDSIMSGVEKTGNKLEEFEWSEYDTFSDNEQYEFVLKVIMKQKNLKKLDFNGPLYISEDQLLNVEELPLRLEYLRVNYFNYPSLIQFQNLKFLSVGSVDSEDLNIVMTRLPNLTTLVFGFAIDVVDSVEIAMNSSIINLEFIDSDAGFYPPVDIMQRVMLVLPELKTLKFERSIDANMMEFVATNMMKLETLTYGFTDDGATERYEAMKIKTINMNIKVMQSK